MKEWSLVLSKEVNVTKEGDHYVDQDGNLWNDFELACLQEEPDWEQVRIQASIEFAAQILANHGGTPASVAKNALDYADALVAELQKKGGQDDNNH